MLPVLAIDPGPEQSGYVWFGPGDLRPDVKPNEHVLNMCQVGNPVVIEMIASYGMPVGKTTFETCVWIGRFIQAHAPYGKAERITRAEIKMALCNSMRAKDSNVWQALIDRFGDPGTKANPGLLYGVKSHARAALALATVYRDRHNLWLPGERSGR